MLKVKDWLREKKCAQFESMLLGKEGRINIARRLSDSRIFFRNMNYKFVEGHGSLVIKEFLPDKIHVNIDVFNFDKNTHTIGEMEINELGEFIKIKLS